MIGSLPLFSIGFAKHHPAFCAGTKTVADLAYDFLAANKKSLGVPHQVDAILETFVKNLPTSTIATNCNFTNSKNPTVDTVWDSIEVASLKKDIKKSIHLGSKKIICPKLDRLISEEIISQKMSSPHTSTVIKQNPKSN